LRCGSPKRRPRAALVFPLGQRCSWRISRACRFASIYHTRDKAFQWCGRTNTSNDLVLRLPTGAAHEHGPCSPVGFSASLTARRESILVKFFAALRILRGQQHDRGLAPFETIPRSQGPGSGAEAPRSGRPSGSSRSRLGHRATKRYDLCAYFWEVCLQSDRTAL
jgi:hypothetical protein